MTEQAYVLGTHDAEIERLGLQHRVWRPYALDAWRRAGITGGQRVIDFGAGPGFATTDLAEIVGPDGHVFALERSERFLAALRARVEQLHLANVGPVEIDLAVTAPGALEADAAWARWIFAFLPQPERAIERLHSALRTGGVFVAHEYLDYATWKLAPRSDLFERFVFEVMQSWRAAGGEPNVGLDMPRWLEQGGFEIVSTRSIVETVRPSDFMWRWPVSFVEINLDRLVEIGRLDAETARATREDFTARVQAPGVRIVTPIVQEVIARKID